MKPRAMRIAAGMVICLLVAVLLSLVNGRSLGAALGAGVISSLIVGVIVASLEVAADLAERKGYSPWLGCLLIALLNLPGMIILLLLPKRSGEDA